MQFEQNPLHGKVINGISGAFNVKIRLNPAQKLEIHLQNRQTYETYFLLVKQEQIKRENIKNHCDFIENASELFQYVQYSLTESINFQEIMKVDERGKIIIKLEMKIDFKQGSKRKIITYDFQTVKQSISAIEKLRNQLNSLVSDKLKFEKEVLKRIEDLQLENSRLRQQVKASEALTKNKQNSELLKFATNRSKLIIKNDVFLQTENKINVILIGQPFIGQSAYEWKIRINQKMVLVFGAGTPQLTSLQNNALEEAINEEKLLIKQCFNGGEILTFTYEEGELKYLIEKVDIEEDEGSNPQPNYNMRRGSFMCKKLMRMDQFYPCFGLHFGGSIQILAFNKK